MPDAFISYSRKNIAFAHLLLNAFENNGIQAWIDWQDIPPSVDWLNEVYEAIEQSDTFIYIISENSIESEICDLEIAHAVKNNKRLIPIVVNEVEPSKVPNPLAELNWIFFTNEDQFSDSISDLIKAIQTDQNLVKIHTRMQNRALAWSRKDQAKSSLLRGDELAQAESWLSEASGKDPTPTNLQSKFIFSSRKETERRQRIGIITTSVFILAAVILSIWAIFQRIEAVQTTQARATAESDAISESNARATAQAELQEQIEIVTERTFMARLTTLLNEINTDNNENLDLGILLTIELVKMNNSLESRTALLNALTVQPYLERFLHRGTGINVHNMVFDPLGNLVVVSPYDNQLLIFDLEFGKLVKTIKTPIAIRSGLQPIYRSFSYEAIQFSTDGSYMVSYSPNQPEELTWTLWDTETYEPIGNPFTENINIQTILCISPTMNYLATTEEGEIKIWNRETGEFVSSFPEPDQGLLYPPIFSFDDSFFLIRNSRKSLMQVDLLTGELIQYFDYDPDIGVIIQVELSPQNTTVGIQTFDEIILIDLLTGENISNDHDETFTLGDVSTMLFFNPDGNAYTISSRWNFDEDREIFDQDYYSLTLIDSGDTLLSQFSSISIRGFETMDRLISVTNPIKRINKDDFHVAFHRSNQGNFEITTFTPLQIYQFIESIEFNQEMENHNVSPLTIFHPSNENIIAVGQCNDSHNRSDCEISVWDLTENDPLKIQSLDVNSGIDAMEFQSHGQSIAVVKGDDSLVLWDWSLDVETSEIEEINRDVDSIIFSPNGKYIALSSRTSDVPVSIFDPENDFSKIQLDLGYSNDLAFHPQKQWLAVVDGDAIVLWDIDSKSVIAELSTDSRQDIYDFVAFHPNGTLLSTGGRDGIGIWDLETFELLYQPDEKIFSTDEIQYFAFDPTGSWLISGINDKIQLFDSLTGVFVGEISPADIDGLENAYEYYLLPTPDFNFSGTRLVVYARSNELLFWKLDLDSWLRIACQIANRNLTTDEWDTYFGSALYRETCP